MMGDVELRAWGKAYERKSGPLGREPTVEELLNAAADRIDGIEERTPLLLPMGPKTQSTGVGAANLLRQWARVVSDE
jgi:hypothetical protein